MDNEKVFNEVSGLVNEMLELVRNYDVAGLENLRPTIPRETILNGSTCWTP